MKFIIKIEDYDGSEFEAVANNKAEAIELAERASDDPNNDFVIIFAYRKSDGQTIYLNRDGYSPTGRSWR